MCIKTSQRAIRLDERLLYDVLGLTARTEQGRGAMSDRGIPTYQLRVGVMVAALRASQKFGLGRTVADISPPFQRPASLITPPLLERFHIWVQSCPVQSSRLQLEPAFGVGAMWSRGNAAGLLAWA